MPDDNDSALFIEIIAITNMCLCNFVMMDYNFPKIRLIR